VGSALQSGLYSSSSARTHEFDPNYFSLAIEVARRYKESASERETRATVSFPKPSLAIIATLLCGGLGGSVFTYWVNRPKTTIVSYTLSSATIADSESGSVIPGLKVQIGSQDVRNLYTHSIVLTVTKGPQIDSADVAIDFPLSTKFFAEPGIATPSPVHKLDCSKIPSGLICRMSPVRREDKLPPFRVSVATDEKADPELVTSTKGLDLQPAQETLTAASKLTTYLESVILVLTVLTTLAGGVLTNWVAKRSTAREAELAMIAGREAEQAKFQTLRSARRRALEELARRAKAASGPSEHQS